MRVTVIVLALLVVLASGFSGSDSDQPAAQAMALQASTALRTGEPRVLLLMCNRYGANYNWIRDVMEIYGWDITTVGVTPKVSVCFYGDSLTVDSLVTEITDVSQFDCLAVMPASSPGAGGPHAQLLQSPEALALVYQAASDSLLVVAFCTGVRVLAAADVIDGKLVTGNPTYMQEYLDAGAIWAGEPLPPVLDGNILTSTRNQTNAQRVCEFMRTAIDSIRVVRAGGQR